jgi:hypothetical protein
LPGKSERFGKAARFVEFDVDVAIAAGEARKVNSQVAHLCF